MIYGRSSIHPVRDITDLIGIRTLVLRQFWTIGAPSASLEGVDGLRPAIPAVARGLMLMGEQVMKERGRYASLWTFQGIHGDGKSVTFKNRQNSIDYGFDPGFSQIPIQLHKDFEKLMEKYQGAPSNDGATVLWPPELPENSTSGNVLNKTVVGGTAMNPMFGIQAYFEMDGIYRFRYAEKEIPENLQKGVGMIADQLPGKPPKLSDGRDWLKAPSSYQRKGSVYDITEYYWLSRRGGWPKPVYGGDGTGGAA